MNIRIPLLCAGLVGLAGCVAPQPRTFVLGPRVGPYVATPATLGPDDSRLEVGKVTVPEYLDNERILLRQGQEVLVDSTARWLEPLSQGMTHALVAGLTTRLPEDSIITDGSADSPDRLLSVTVDAFDVWPNGRCVLTASWTVLQRSTNALLISGYGTFVTASAVGPGKLGDEALVGAVSRAIGQLTEKIAIGTIANEITAGVHPNLSKFERQQPPD